MIVYGADAVSDYLKYAVNVNQVPGTMTPEAKRRAQVRYREFHGRSKAPWRRK